MYRVYFKQIKILRVYFKQFKSTRFKLLILIIMYRHMTIITINYYSSHVRAHDINQF